MWKRSRKTLTSKGVRPVYENMPICDRVSPVPFSNCFDFTHLIDDMVPCTRRFQADQLIVQSLSHGLDSTTHDVQISHPSSSQLLTFQNSLDNRRAVLGGHGNLRSEKVGKCRV